MDIFQTAVGDIEGIVVVGDVSIALNLSDFKVGIDKLVDFLLPKQLFLGLGANDDLALPFGLPQSGNKIETTVMTDVPRSCHLA